MMRARRTSGDLLADKRFAYAEALAAEGVLAGAIDLYEQTIARVPGWAPAYLAWGIALEKLGERTQAEAAFARAKSLDPDGTLGAGLRHARLAGGRVDALPPAYVKQLFDDYAPRFEAHLTDGLAYRGPDVIVSCLARLAGPPADGNALDLGCGTGLMARALAPRTAPIDGVDLSDEMIALSRATGLYRRLIADDCIAGLQTLAAADYDLVVAADVLVYMGDLEPLAAEIARVLAPGGLFAATLQAGDETPYALGEDLRFHHNPAYVRDVFSKHAIRVEALNPCTTRREAGRDVPGLVFAARAA